MICPEASSAQNRYHGCGAAACGSTVYFKIRGLSSSCNRSDRVRGSDRFPLARREPRECEQLVAGFLQAVGDDAARAAICG